MGDVNLNDIGFYSNSNYFANVIAEGASANYGVKSVDVPQEAEGPGDVGAAGGDPGGAEGVKTERLLNKAVVMGPKRTIDDADKQFAQSAAKKLGFASLDALKEEVAKTFVARTEERGIALKGARAELLGVTLDSVTEAVLSSVAVREALELMDPHAPVEGLHRGTALGPETVREAIVSTLGLINEGKLDPVRGDHIAFVNERVLDVNDPSSMAVMSAKVLSVLEKHVEDIGSWKATTDALLSRLETRLNDIHRDIRTLVEGQKGAGQNAVLDGLLRKIDTYKADHSSQRALCESLLTEVENAHGALPEEARAVLLNGLARLMADAFVAERKQDGLAKAVDAVRASRQAVYAGKLGQDPEKARRKEEIVATLQGIRKEAGKFGIDELMLARRDMTLSQKLRALLDKSDGSVLSGALQEIGKTEFKREVEVPSPGGLRNEAESGDWDALENLDDADLDEDDSLMTELYGVQARKDEKLQEKRVFRRSSGLTNEQLKTVDKFGRFVPGLKAVLGTKKTVNVAVAREESVLTERHMMETFDDGLRVALNSLITLAESLEKELQGFEKSPQTSDDPEQAAVEAMLDVQDRLKSARTGEAEVKAIVEAQQKLLDVLRTDFGDAELNGLPEVGELSADDVSWALDADKALRQKTLEQLAMTGRKVAEREIFRNLEASMANVLALDKEGSVYNGAEHMLRFTVEMGAAFKLAGLVDVHAGARVGCELRLSIGKDRSVTVTSGSVFELVADVEVGTNKEFGVGVGGMAKVRGGVTISDGRRYEGGVQEMLRNSPGELLVTMEKLNQGNFHRMGKLRKDAARADNRGFVNELISMRLLDRTDQTSFVGANREVVTRVKQTKAGVHAEGEAGITFNDEDVASIYAEADVNYVSEHDVKFKPIIDNLPRKKDGKIPCMFVTRETVRPVSGEDEEDDAQVRKNNRQAVLKQLDERLRMLRDFQQACKCQQNRSLRGKYDKNITLSDFTADRHFNEFAFHWNRKDRDAYTTDRKLWWSGEFDKYAAMGLRAYAYEAGRLREVFDEFAKDATEEEREQLEIGLAEMRQMIYNPDFKLPGRLMESALYLSEDSDATKAVEWSTELSVTHELFGGVAVSVEGRRPVGQTELEKSSPFRERETVSASFTLRNVPGMEALTEVFVLVMQSMNKESSTSEKAGAVVGGVVISPLMLDNELIEYVKDKVRAAKSAAELEEKMAGVRENLINKALEEITGAGGEITEERRAEIEEEVDALIEERMEAIEQDMESMAELVATYVDTDGWSDKDLSIRVNYMRGDDGRLHVESFEIVKSKAENNSLRLGTGPMPVGGYVKFELETYDEAVLFSRIRGNTFGNLIDMFEAWYGPQGKPRAWTNYVSRNAKTFDHILDSVARAIDSPQNPKAVKKLPNICQEFINASDELVKVEDAETRRRLSELYEALDVALKAYADKESRTAETREQTVNKLLVFLSELREARQSV